MKPPAWTKLWSNQREEPPIRGEGPRATNDEDIVPLLKQNSNEWKLEECQLENEVVSKSPRYSALPQSLAHLLLVASFSIFVASAFFYAYRTFNIATDQACQRKMWAYSPEANILEFETRQYDSDIIPHEYSGPPTEERRMKWKQLWATGRIGFPYDKLRLVNRSTELRDWWRLPPPRQDTVITMSEVMHQIHCVSLIWQFIHREEWDFRGVKGWTAEFFEVHNRHCSIVLMNVIKCRADMTPVLLQVSEHMQSGQGEGQGAATALANLGRWKLRDAPRRCKKFEALAEWERENRICPEECRPQDIARIYGQ